MLTIKPLKKINKMIVIKPLNKIIKNNKIKIYEMFMRDGLQSLKPYNFDQKKLFLNQIMKNNFSCIEYGSTTNNKLLPQMNNSFELWNYIKDHENYNNKINYTMLVPHKLNECIASNIRSFGLICTISDNFAKSNLKKTADESIDNMLSQLDNIMLLSEYHVRIYISCSFGEPPDGNLEIESLNKLINLLEKIQIKIKENYIEPDNLDIVFADTVGSITEQKIDNILKNVNNDLIDYISLHLHSDKNFYPYINKSLEYNIKKFDSSLLGIGGCPFAKKETVGNISTYSLVKYLHLQGYNTNLNLNLLKETQTILKDLLKMF